MGEEMSQNSFIQQYLAKQQELLRQRLEREAREACDTNGKACFNLFAVVLTICYVEIPLINIIFFPVIEQQEHTEVNNSSSCPQVRHVGNFFFLLRTTVKILLFYSHRLGQLFFLNCDRC